MNAESESPKRVYPPTYLLVAVVLMVCLHLLVPVRQVIFAPYRYLGLIPLAAGLVVVLSVAANFQRAGTTIKPFEESSTLVVSGVYRVTRNPIYLGMVCSLIGVGVLAGSVTPFLVVPAFAYMIDRRFIRAEEALLEQTFGSQYGAYKARVRRWL
jgi:protein-S-isoprenylcysteine O-methyltransferase Ste14